MDTARGLWKLPYGVGVAKDRAFKFCFFSWLACLVTFGVSGDSLFEASDARIGSAMLHLDIEFFDKSGEV